MYKARIKIYKPVVLYIYFRVHLGLGRGIIYYIYLIIKCVMDPTRIFENYLIF